MENNCYPFTNLPLPYAFDALEPWIDEKTMELHHDKHLQTYIDNLNDALKKYPRLQKFSLEELLCNLCQFPQNVQQTIRNNAGGVYNHRLFFDLLTPDSNRQPEGNLYCAIIQNFFSYDHFKETFKKTALSVFGSGYAWLVFHRGKLRIVTTANQNTPLESGMCPLLLIDVWEHAYYLKHYNQRNSYIDDWFQVINWEKAEQIFLRYQ
ncbi:MAG: superoxide dismutase [Lachnospiraceae bacterium]